MDSTFPKVFIVILNFNGENTLPACLTSVFKSDYSNFETIIVDNNSKDESFEKARQQYSKMHFIKNSENVGFSRGNNIGIRYALEKFADYVFLLNNDTIIERSTISSLVQAAKDSYAGILSPIVLTPKNEDIWFAGGSINWFGMKNTHLTSIPSETPYSTEYISGCAMFISKDVFKKIGLFDERFFLYYEDADFSLRAKKAGFKLLMVPFAKIIHLEQSTEKNPKKTYWLVLSGLIFFKTHASFVRKIWLHFYVSLRKIKNLWKIYFSNDSCAQSVRQAYKDFKKIK